MIAAMSLVCLLSSPFGGAVSSDDIDDYIDQVVKARKACGPTSVWYCLRRLGHSTELREIWDEASIEADGVWVSNLLELFQKHGVTAKAVRGDPARLDTLPTLSVLIIDDKHCIVYEGLDPENNMVRYFEPALGRTRTVPREEVEKHWSGEAILLGPPLLSARALGAIAFIGLAGILGIAAALQWFLFRARPLATASTTVSTAPP